MLFFDTSALVKRYAIERGTEAVDELIDETERSIIVTSLSVIETTSALRRKQNVGELTEQRRDDLLVEFFREATGPFTLVPIDDGFVRAFDLVLKDDLRTLDSLQLGTALELAGQDVELTFVCADGDLVDVAENRGLATLNPVAEEG
jgi:predicted nucleic acid-binding protein